MKSLSKSSAHQIIAQYNIQDIVTIVKELLENSLDSGADTIEVKIQESGKNGITVQDNGCGIKSDNIGSVCRQGCTSKITDASDINNVQTLGFRGMALFSISKIATISLETHHAEDPEGWGLTIQDGAIRNVGKSSIAKGTKVLVSDIFFGNPIRSQDLMTKKEFYIRKVTELVQSYNIFHFNKKISLENSINNKKHLLIPSVAASSLNIKLRGILGSETVSNFKSFVQDRNGLKAEMTMSNPTLDLKKKLNLCFINGRLVTPPKILLESMNLAFAEFKRSWSFVLFLTIPRGLDVNVSIDKMTVLIEHEREIFEFWNEFFQHVLQSWTQEVALKQFVPVSDTVKKNRVFDSEETKDVTVLPLNFHRAKPGINSSEELKKEKSLDSLKKVTEKNRTVVRTESTAEVASLMVNSLKSLETFDSPKQTEGVKVDSRYPLSSFVINSKKLETNDNHSNIAGSGFKEVETTENKSIKVNEGQFQSHETVPASSVQDSKNKSPVFSSFQINWNLSSIASSPPKHFTLMKSPRQSSSPSKSNLSKDVFLNFHKSDFLSLDIKGQYNKGFIIAESSSKLFIIDQHAADEKFLFETLQKTTEIHTQPLLISQKLDLPPCDELFLLENTEIFKENGFSLTFKEQNPPGSRFFIQGFPFSYNVVFGVEDFYESFAKLKETSEVVNKKDLPQVIRCKKFRDMFASRACRKAVMIGTDLSLAKMKEIVKNLNGLDRPWNCPHGRPTIKLLLEQDFNQRRTRVNYNNLTTL